MTMKHNVFLYVKNHFGVLFALIFFGLAACEEEANCVTDNTNIVTLQFTKLLANEGGNAEEDYQDSVIVTAEGTIAGIPEGGASLIGLPLDPANNTTTFYIYRQLEEGVFTVDTLVLRYRREQTLISPECGPDQRFFDVDTVLSTFDSIRVRNPEVQQSGTIANLQVFTCRYELTNVMQLEYTYAANDDDISDTLFVSRIYSNIGKEDILLDTAIAEGESITVAVPVARNENQAQVFLETAEATPTTYHTRAFYRLDAFQVADCLPQDRYRLDSMQLWVNADSLADPAPEVVNTTFNINTTVNGEIIIQ